MTDEVYKTTAINTPIPVQLKLDEIKWIRLKWKKIRTAQQRADAEGNRWNRLNDEINHYLDESGITDVVQRSRQKEQSLALRDAHDAGKWFAGEAMRHIADVDLFLRMKQVGVL